MKVTFYLEMQDRSKHAYTNYTVTKMEEIDWLLKHVRKHLEEALLMKEITKKFIGADTENKFKKAETDIRKRF